MNKDKNDSIFLIEDKVSKETVAPRSVITKVKGKLSTKTSISSKTILQNEGEIKIFHIN